MPCPRTEHLLREYFADEPDPLLGAEIERHVADCPDCAAQLRQLLGPVGRLRDWKEMPAPRWDRHLPLFQRERAAAPGAWRLVRQWLPAAACMFMLGLMLLNTTVVFRDGAMEIGFGAPTLAAMEASLEANLEEFQRLRAEEREQFIELLTRFEQSRIEDLQAMQTSYELLADQDYETVLSLRQLASLVEFASTAESAWEEAATW